MNPQLQTKLLLTCLDDLIEHATALREAAKREYLDPKPDEDEPNDEPCGRVISDTHLERMDDALYAWAGVRNSWAEATEVETGDLEIAFSDNDRYTAPS